MKCACLPPGDGGDSTTALPQAWVTIPLPLCPPFRGDNELGLRWLGDGSDDAAAVRQEVRRHNIGLHSCFISFVVAGIWVAFRYRCGQVAYMEELIVTVEP